MVLISITTRDALLWLQNSERKVQIGEQNVTYCPWRWTTEMPAGKISVRMELLQNFHQYLQLSSWNHPRSELKEFRRDNTQAFPVHVDPTVHMKSAHVAGSWANVTPEIILITASFDLPETNRKINFFSRKTVKSEDWVALWIGKTDEEARIYTYGRIMRNWVLCIFSTSVGATA